MREGAGVIEYRKPAAAAKAPAPRKTHGSVLLCPHCGTRTLIRTSRQINELFREGYSICTSCAFMGKYVTHYIAECVPSVSPNPRVSLPALPRHQAANDIAASLAAEADQMDLFARSG